MGSRRFRSFSDPETHFRLVQSDTPASVDGYKIGEPTSEVACEECGQSAAAPEYIAHMPGCDQVDVKFEQWKKTHLQNHYSDW